jgi:hypothetical protein
MPMSVANMVHGIQMEILKAVEKHKKPQGNSRSAKRNVMKSGEER